MLQGHRYAAEDPVTATSPWTAPLTALDGSDAAAEESGHMMQRRSEEKAGYNQSELKAASSGATSGLTGPIFSWW